MPSRGHDGKEFDDEIDVDDAAEMRPYCDRFNPSVKELQELKKWKKCFDETFSELDIKINWLLELKYFKKERIVATKN